MSQPTKEIVATKCSIYQNHFDSLKGKLVCDFDLNSNEYAWVSEQNQHLSGETNFPKDQLQKNGVRALQEVHDCQMQRIRGSQKESSCGERLQSLLSMQDLNL
jgi:hypothetical protein